MEQKTVASMNADVQRAQERYAYGLGQLKKELEAKVARVQSWALANPEEFGKRKSIEFTHGTVGFRTGTPKLALLNRKWNWEKALERVEALLPNFIRSKPEIDKEAILAQRDEEVLQFAIEECGMKVVQDESFYVEPTMDEVETREVANA